MFPPLGEYLIALLNKLVNTCSILFRSPRIIVSSNSTRKVNLV